MPDFFTINRSVLLVRPSAAMVEWLNSLYPNDPLSKNEMLGDDNTDVYLLPEFQDIAQAHQWLRSNYLDIFEATLESWCADSDDWPEVLDWPAFEKMVDFTIQTNVIDTVSEEEDERQAGRNARSNYAAFDDDDDDDLEDWDDD